MDRRAFSLKRDGPAEQRISPAALSKIGRAEWNKVRKHSERAHLNTSQCAAAPQLPLGISNRPGADNAAISQSISPSLRGLTRHSPGVSIPNALATAVLICKWLTHLQSHECDRQSKTMHLNARALQLSHCRFRKHNHGNLSSPEV